MKDLKAVIFDIDGTLTPQNSWTAFTRDIGGSVEDHLEIYHSHLNGKIGLDESKRQLLAIWQATGRAERSYIEQSFESWPVREEAYTLIKWLQHSGFVVCLITGSVGLYAKHMAEKLNVDDYYANAELYFDEKGMLADFHYTADQAEVKLTQFSEFCRLKRLQPEECVAVGDGNNDIELFRHTQHGIL